MPAPAPTPLLRARGLGVWRSSPLTGRVRILEGVDMEVRPGEHWAVLGPNGAGKSTLLAILAADGHPTEGVVEVLGRRLGAVDKRDLRALIGSVPDRLAERFDPRLTVREVVRTGATGVITPDGADTAPEVAARAEEMIDLLGLRPLAGRLLRTGSRGERQRTLIARALMPAPRLLVLDEAAAGLDLPGREAVVGALERLAAAAPGLASVSVSHHLEELPATTSHVLLLRGGATVAAGPVATALTDATLSECFAMDARVERRDGRFAARAARAPGGVP